MFPETQVLIRELIEGLVERKAITKKQGKYLGGKNPPRERYFYLLPKIHINPEKWPIPHKVPPGRPIVSDCDSESYRIAEYLDAYLTPLSKGHNSYIKDTPDFISKIRKIELREPCILFTMDVNNLYTNIDTRLGTRAVQTLLKKNPDPDRPDREILRLLELI